MAKMNQKTKRAIFGMIGALIGAVPVTILKYIIIVSDFDWLCTHIGNFFEFELYTCGLIGYPSWAYLFFILFGGALFGFLSEHILPKKPQKQEIDPSILNEKNVFGQSFVAGLFFDLLFVFIFIGIT